MLLCILLKLLALHQCTLSSEEKYSKLNSKCRVWEGWVHHRQKSKNSLEKSAKTSWATTCCLPGGIQPKRLVEGKRNISIYQSCSGTQHVEEMFPAHSSGSIHMMCSHGAGSWLMDDSSPCPLPSTLFYYSCCLLFLLPYPVELDREY